MARPLDRTIAPLTEAEKAHWPQGVVVQMEKAHADERGEIQPLVDLPMKSCVLIHSRAGTVRANHYHKTDWHFCYVLSGRIEYWHRPVGNKDKPRKVVIKEGQTFFTPPMVEHAMVFPVDTSFLTLGRNSRAQEVYEADVVRVPNIVPRPGATRSTA
jgi:dTDP-4-dehydrorhamnose 3,5-epimerase-like enzyme